MFALAQIVYASFLFVTLNDILNEFIQVMPIDYKRVLVERTEHNEEIESVFETQ